ncbi:HNH endonuclease signature motif containing protein [Pseudonocardia spinosispora]|uniref:HNH endonuclease signature motif containing protein n=1 Tax=Pseudonocardia spinosispora TaxID=103441 RepID=UPI000A044B2D|nr:HNH endonuclease signature motif containing protein [Pseudonocardia spinosispora]
MSAVTDAAGLAEMPPGPSLAAALACIDRARVSNGDMIEVLRARYRLRAHLDAQLAADIADIGLRDPRSDRGSVAYLPEPGQFAADELRPALSWTRRRAEAELDFSWELTVRLPWVFDALDSGDIDLPKARVFATYLADLPLARRTEICAAVLPKAPGWTTGRLAAHLRKLVISADPQSARELYEKALARRRVVGYLDSAGTAVLSANDIAPEDMAAACTRISRLAAAVKRRGHPARMDQLRADLFCGLLDGTLHSLSRTEIIDHFLGSVPSGKAQGIEVRAELGTLLGISRRPGELPGWGPLLADNTRSAVLAQRGGSWYFAVCDDDGYLLVPGITRRRPLQARDLRDGGMVELQVSTSLLARLMESPPVGWEAVIADIAAQYAAWPTASAAFDSQPGRRFPTAGLRRANRMRDRTCRGPGCRRPATESQFDHTVDHARGGPTTDANGGQLCAHDHDLKTRGHWCLKQPEPGVFLWTSPLGQVHRTRGDPVIIPPLTAPEDDLPPF